MPAISSIYDSLTVLSDGANVRFFAQMFDDYPEGVSVYDIRTHILYYNRAQGGLDDMLPEQVLGKTLLELYRVRDNTSFPTLRCLFSRKPIVNYPCYYYTNLGKLINSIHNVFPFFSGNRLTGCICFIRDYGHMIGQSDALGGRESPALDQDAAGGAKKVKFTFEHILTQSPLMRKSLEAAARSALSPSPVLIQGETGCGKEMVAQAIHNISPRRDKPFLPISCAAIPENLLEGILFGTVPGAFTGALNKPGLLELADGGTIFLDEINSMPLGLQSKLLRAIQESRVRRVGDSQERAVSLKIISASNVPLREAMVAGSFRADLLFRLGVVGLSLPPLRARPEDIPLLTRHFIDKLNRCLHKNIRGLTGDLERLFLSYRWPGNVRELEHALEGAMNMALPNESILDDEHFSISLVDVNLLNEGGGSRDEGAPDFGAPANNLKQAAQKGEMALLVQALEQAEGNAARAARALEISPQLMNYKIKKYGLKKKVPVKSGR